MNESTYFLTSDGELYHYGVLGMKWGVRRAQKMASNKAYIDMMNRRVDSLDPEMRSRVETSMVDYLKNRRDS